MVHVRKFSGFILGGMASGSYIRSIVIVNIFALNVGVYIGWTPWLIRSLEHSYMGVTVDEITWVASVAEIGDLIGGFIILFVGNHTGRKSMLLCASLPLTVGWTTLLFSNTLLVIYLTRIIMGIGTGMCYSLFPMYFTEIALVNHRGLITSSQTFSVELGMLLMYTYCAFVSLNDMPVFPIALLVISGLLLLTVPETPHYLAFRKDYEGVKESLKQLHGDFHEKEFQMIVRHVNDCTVKNSWKDLFLVPHNRKIFLVVTLVVVASQFGGNAVTTTYINDILISLGKELSMPYLNILIGIVVCVGALCNMLLLDYLGRKSTFLLSIIGGGIASVMIAVCSFPREKNYQADNVGNVGVGGILLLTFMGSFGYTSVLRVFVSEVFATNVRTFAVAYLSCLTTICVFIAVKVFGIIIKRIGTYVTFSIFVGFSMVTLLLGTFFLPETKCKTFDEIQNSLAKKSSRPSPEEGKETSENYSAQ